LCGPFHYNAWRTTYFDPAVTAAKLDDVTPHDLRASHASWVAERHGVMAAARRLGHAHGSVTTRHYARSIDARDVEVASEFDRQHSSPRGSAAERVRDRDVDSVRRESQRGEEQEKHDD
jgi:integrase